MGDFITYLQHRVEETKRRVQETTDRMNQAISERETLVADLAGYERALSAEMRGQGMTVQPQAVQIPLDGSAAGTTGTNKAEFARQFIRRRADLGAKPNDIFQGFQDAGISITKPYIYALVQRLQKQGAIRLKRDRWFAVPESAHSADGSSSQSLP